MHGRYAYVEPFFNYTEFLGNDPQGRAGKPQHVAVDG